MRMLLHKKNNNKGYSIAELLIVIAILGIVLSAVTVGVSAAMRQYQLAMRRERVNLLFSALYERIVSEFRYGTGFSGPGIGTAEDPDGAAGGAGAGGGAADPDTGDAAGGMDTIVYTSTGMNMSGSIINQSSNPEGRTFIAFESSVPVVDRNNPAASPAVRTQLLVPESSYFGSMSAEITELKYDKDNNVFAITLSVKDDRLGEEYTKTETFMVSPLNMDK